VVPGGRGGGATPGSVPGRWRTGSPARATFTGGQLPVPARGAGTGVPGAVAGRNGATGAFAGVAFAGVAFAGVAAAFGCAAFGFAAFGFAGFGFAFFPDAAGFAFAAFFDFATGRTLPRPSDDHRPTARRIAR
jgi:hypothetical protein